MSSVRIKRGIDIVVSLFLLVALTPVFLVVSVLVLAALGWPIFFVQSRAGLRGKIFQLIKFRSMRDGRPNESDRERLTSFGRCLRRLSLDELPELIHVLRGEMSLVGPRPLMAEYLHLYSPAQSRRHDVRPGITGWAQIHGRNTLSWEDRFDLDVWYVDHWNLWIDFKILCLTAVHVVKQSGISATNHETMPKFTGENRERANG